MKSKNLLLGALMGLALGQVSVAQEIAKPLSSLGAASVSRKVACHGVSAVPMTADQEQALPMTMVATLKCNDEVVVLAEDEGYTVKVRTADGKTGFIARLYLAPAPDSREVAVAHPSESAAVVNGVARWQLGTPGSDELSNNGTATESLTVNGVTVQVSLQDTGWKLRANVAIANDGLDHVSINPARFTLSSISPTAHRLAYEDPRQMAKALNHQILWTSASAFAPAGAAQFNGSGAHVANVGYKTPVAPPAGTSATALITSPSAELHGVVLHEGAILPSNKVEGSVWFERDKKAEQLVLRVPVNGVTFEFPLSFNHDK
jgi:hypothetical protein